MAEVQHIGRVSAWRALLEGSQAARDGKTAKDLPYPYFGGANDRMKARFWLRGFSKARNLLAKQEAAARDGATQAP